MRQSDQPDHDGMQVDPEVVSRLEMEARGSRAGTLWVPKLEPTSKRLSIDSLTRMITFIALASYAIGLVVVNGYLFGLGISDFELLRPRFVMTGLLVLSTLAVVTYGLLYAGWLLLHQVFARSRIDFVWRLLSLAKAAIGVGLPWVVLRYVLRQDTFTALVLYWFTGVLGLIVLHAAFSLGPGKSWLDRNQEEWRKKREARKRSARGSRMRTRRDVPSWVSRFALPVFLVPYLFMYFAIFATDVYPSVPEQFGGGRPKAVRFLVKSDAVDQLESIGVSVNEHNVTQRLELVFQGSDYYAVGSRLRTLTLIISTSEVVGVEIIQEK
jgi:hypothetical protein